MLEDGAVVKRLRRLLEFDKEMDFLSKTISEFLYVNVRDIRSQSARVI